MLRKTSLRSKRIRRLKKSAIFCESRSVKIIIHQIHYIQLYVQVFQSRKDLKPGIRKPNRHWIHRACTMHIIRLLEKAGSHTWCHILPGMLSKRLLVPMEYLVRARLLRVLEAASRETSLHGWSILLTHALYKFSKVHTKDTRSPCVQQPSNGIR